LNWLIRGLSSSVGKKFVMGVTGLLLCGFLVVHLAGNFLLYAGPDAYNAYAHRLHQQEALLKVAEVGLATLFVVHIGMSILLTLQNRSARDVDYARKDSKMPERLISTDTWMFTSGVVVLGFLLLHLGDFTFEIRTDIAYEKMEPYDKAVALLKTPVTFIGYVVGCLFLGFHLWHGFSSAFQSLGLNHPKYNRLIHVAGMAFAVILAAGFISYPLWAAAFKTAAGSP
jgi:succinate dehydrogenase / fumarate reductase cytochrome b subunit